VVYQVTGQRRRGFGLPGDPESGEEAFVVEHQREGMVVLHVTAFSATRYARLAHPQNGHAE
jgi:uncharacterized protein (UPF0548 family)